MEEAKERRIQLDNGPEKKKAVVYGIKPMGPRHQGETILPEIYGTKQAALETALELANDSETTAYLVVDLEVR